MADIGYPMVKVTFPWGWQKTHKTKRKYRKVKMNETEKENVKEEIGRAHV